ncbi:MULTISPECIES: MerR family DNA-binding transcriptional regulator [unclassified Paenibacillus]|uniref:MerR family DNA-binding transcriptional regulator n=1 Tax=unclassified Paenibacillus TaxID=185978 RepID=UPI0009FAA382|nr:MULTISPECIES: MerR family DNA-binding transcriptional regulator [unclassified Paenibacillus]
MSLSIKEASERLGIPPHTIRFYERKGLLPFLQRDPYGTIKIRHYILSKWVNLRI